MFYIADSVFVRIQFTIVQLRVEFMISLPLIRHPIQVGIGKEWILG